MNKRRFGVPALDLVGRMHGAFGSSARSGMFIEADQNQSLLSLEPTSNMRERMLDVGSREPGDHRGSLSINMPFLAELQRYGSAFAGFRTATGLAPFSLTANE